MVQRLAAAALLAATTILSATAVHAQRPSPPPGPLTDGFLCCNMRTYGDSISDINYDEQGTSIVPVGTPARITAYDFRFFNLDLAGKPQRIKNDYSRNITLIDFAKRYVVTEDPKRKIASFPPAVGAAILAGKVMPGMTREQVLMALGYPVASENPSLDAPVWRYWRDSWSEFQVNFDAQGLVKDVAGNAVALSRVLAAAP
ncbi:MULTISPECIES: outer membrane protein assembly factor BamE [Variovorax]|uniref:outer membrane protein assembly factor BamE domain-containing protein n=1 Tax=Variovorax TaxID=34072 RepID=UPI0007806BE3|nr:outer membrane protein assembly factor BamE [Variovorax boronicumulans]OEZ30620.1 cell envelope protein SmpA [Variovorax boronicumulans]GER09780.1 outer membrane protein assembly factor BamE [Variovorax boronicumulans]